MTLEEAVPLCDLCGLEERPDDWNPDTGNHRSCEADEAAAARQLDAYIERYQYGQPPAEPAPTRLYRVVIDPYDITPYDPAEDTGARFVYLTEAEARTASSMLDEMSRHPRERLDPVQTFSADGVLAELHAEYDRMAEKASEARYRD